MRFIIQSIPNAITCCNLLCGCVAIVASCQGNYHIAYGAIVAAAVFDFFDGFAARMLKAYSPIGAQLDSLADVVSFGVAPSMMIYAIFRYELSEPVLCYVAFLLAVFSALRLAKFNIDTRQSEEFRGLPTPGMALFFASYTFLFLAMANSNVELWKWITIALIPLFCGLMVCDMPMFSFKFKDFGIQKNILRYSFVAFSVIALVVLQFMAPIAIILAYILVSTTLYLMKR